VSTGRNDRDERDCERDADAVGEMRTVRCPHSRVCTPPASASRDVRGRDLAPAIARRRVVKSPHRRTSDGFKSRRWGLHGLASWST
jgi:hypothetical protein